MKKGLSAREKQVLKRMYNGMRPSVIAAELDLSVKTVSTYKARLFAKLEVTSVAAMIHKVNACPSIVGEDWEPNRIL